MKKKTELLARAYIVVAMFCILALVIAYRVVVINVVEGDKWRSKGAVNLKWNEIVADRGNIYDEAGNLLATSLQFFEIRWDATVPKTQDFNKKVDSLALMLSKTILPTKPASKWKEELIHARKKKNRFFFIVKNADTELRNKIKSFPVFRLGRFGGGFVEVRYGKREKPFGEMASRTIGEDRENAQKVGLEGYFDQFLKGPTNKRLERKVSPTEDLWVPVYDPSDFEIKRGDDVVTTLNINLQDIVHTELENAMIHYNAPKGVAIMMEVKTGAIKAISNLSLVEGKGVEYINTAIGAASEPGSTFKLASVLALFEDNYADVETKVDITGAQATFADRIIKDSEKHNRGLVTLKEAFAISSNVGIAKLANASYNKTWDTRAQFRARLAQFGLDRMTDVEIVGEGAPIIKDPIKDRKSWYATTIPWMSHGYELAITPLQMLNFYNSVANGGKMMKPYIVSSLRRLEEEDKEFSPKVLKDSIASKASIAKAQELLKEVVISGTAKNIKSDIVTIAGKTGTTRVNYSNKAESAKYNASFCGYFPAENPEYSMIVILYEPQGAFYGSTVAAPVFKAIAERTLSWKHEKYGSYRDTAVVNVIKTVPQAQAGYFDDFRNVFEYVGINYKQKSSNSWVYVDPFESKMIVEDRKIFKNKVPDVVGMGGRDAMFVLENLGMQVNIFGRGKVIRQSVSPGTPNQGQKIEIYLN